jgi:hypothetical protein
MIKSKAILALFVSTVMFSMVADAQVYYRVRPYMRGRPYRREQAREVLPPFKPTLSLSFGYGFPNVDKTYLPQYYNAYNGTVSQTGPITAALDYRFMRSTSVGVMVTHGSVSAPYYDYNGSGAPVFKTKLDNWSILLNVMRYFPAGKAVTPYFRTAVGINIWDQQYMDPQGNKISMAPADLPDFAYQLGLGARFNLSKNSGLFLEAGYGKYIVHGGLSFTF